ncbi:hypothetical protein [Sediminibacillus massiliensis]|uniref:hypothetical protein n=1 Tax=Sediminibacillus massiliensis TaxID=1926277 RepID=UPI00098846D2|nr:hypothetical protein [Sediminibacillus massiliensis]
MKKSTIGMIAGSTALVSAGTMVAVKTFQKKAKNEEQGSYDFKQSLKNNTGKTIQKTKSLIDGQMGMMKKEKEALDDMETKLDDNEGKAQADNTIAKKDDIESPDADKDEAEKGLTGLDHEYRAEWVANGFPQTHRDMERLEEEEKNNQ